MSEQNRDNQAHNSSKRRLRYVAVLPSFITLLNGLCGFAAIGFASNGFVNDELRLFKIHDTAIPFFALAGYMIFVAMIADMLDGRVARMSNTTSSFGGQLDSLCDMISFGLAPAFLVLKILEYKLRSIIDAPDVAGGMTYRLIWIAAAVYISCAAIRLARFNVENEEDESAHMDFTGLPSPAAAGVLASIVIFYQDLLYRLAQDIDAPQFWSVINSIISYSLPFITIGTGLLMVSRITYPHMLNHLIRGKRPFRYLLWTVILLALIVILQQNILLVAFCGFALTGCVRKVVMFRKTGRLFNADKETTEGDDIE